MPEPALHIWEPEFIQLWEQGASYRDITQALGCPLGTVASRAAALVAQGKIQPRPRGRAKAQMRTVHGTVQRPVHIEHRCSAVSTPVQCMGSTLDQCSGSIGLKTRCMACASWFSLSSIASITHQCRHRCRSLHCPLPKGKAVRWNLWILDTIRDDLAALAAERGVSPSQLVQELLWKALSHRRSSMP